MSEFNNPPVAGTTTTAIAASPDNIRMIVQSSPKVFLDNRRSHDNCVAAGRQLLDDIRRNGMNEELDKKAAAFIEKSRRTVKKFNDARAPFTRLFDQMRKEFTALENGIDPTKQDSVPWLIQQQRNAYAKKRHEEEEARLKAEETKRQAEIARGRYRQECEEDYKEKLNRLIVDTINKLTQLNDSCTLDNYQSVYDTVSGFSADLDGWNPQSSVRLPFNLSPDESRSIAADVLVKLMPNFRKQFSTEIGDYRQDILDRLPSRRAELENAAKASAQEKARIEANMKAREEAEKAEREKARVAREEEERKIREAKKASSEASNLFAMTATRSTYQPKTKVTKRIRVVGPNGYMALFAMWWSKVGAGLSAEELDKIFKKQISFCESLANKAKEDEKEFIQHPDVQYIDEVKAK